MRRIPYSHSDSKRAVTLSAKTNFTTANITNFTTEMPESQLEEF